MAEEHFAHDIPRFEPEPSPPDELYARVLAAVDHTPAPQIPLYRRLVLVALLLPAVAAAALAGHHVLCGRSLLRADLPSLPPGQLIFELSLLSLLTLGATASAARPGRTGLGSDARLLVATSLAVAPAYLATEILWPLRSQDAEAIAATARLHPWGLPCVVIAAVVGATALAALTWGLRRAVPVCAGLRGAALGAASGAWAGLALFVHCPASALTHVLLSHVAPIAVLTALGALAAPPLLSP